MTPRAIGAVLVDSELHERIDAGSLVLPHEDVQPCSIDLRVGSWIREINGLPDRGSQGFCAERYLDRFGVNQQHKISSTTGYTLKRDNAYLAEVEGEVHLAEDEEGYMNPKSSTGRIDVHCAGIGEGSLRYNVVPRGYRGKIYLLIVPQSFPVTVYPGSKLAQLRLMKGSRQKLQDHDLHLLHMQYGLTRNPDLEPVISDNQLSLRLDLRSSPCCLVAHVRGEPIDLRAQGDMDPTVFFYEKVLDNHSNTGREGGLWLESRQFALMQTIEIVNVPYLTCAEMVAFSEVYGEFRSHYAGFFDRGFTNPAICEVRNTSSVPMRFTHGQELVPLSYEFLTREPQACYGTEGLGSSYSQAVRMLAKYFSAWPD